jgi:hypothetical protein
MMDYSSAGKNLFVLNTYLEHGDSAHEEESLDTKLFRFRNRMNAWGLIVKHTPLRLAAYRVYWLFYVFKHLIKYRDFRFLIP